MGKLFWSKFLSKKKLSFRSTNQACKIIIFATDQFSWCPAHNKTSQFNFVSVASSFGKQILRVHFFKKIQDWIFKSERIWKWILCFRSDQLKIVWTMAPGSEESTAKVPLMRHDPRDLGLICLVKKCKIRFQIPSLKIQSWFFSKETHHKTTVWWPT